MVSGSKFTPVEHYYAVLIYHVYLATIISFPKELKYIVCQSILIVTLVASGVLIIMRACPDPEGSNVDYVDVGF